MTEENGFSLIEAVVACALLALGIATAVQALGLAGRHAERGLETARAVALAQARLAEVDGPEGLRAGAGEGEGGLRWQRSVEPLMSAEAAAEAGSDWIPCRVSVTVRWGAPREHSVELASLRLRRRQ